MTDGVEILSPAGSWETLKTAAAAGADAVYFGASAFNARRNAQNFTNEDIPKVVSYCHQRGIKAHLTLNTLVFDDEIAAALEFAKLASISSIDAIIIQDLGLASLIHKAAPDLQLHASTQLSVHNIEGVMELAKLGFTRVVLARELSLKEIKKITKQSPVEIETFVHGALCMSVSGQCYMSVFFGGCRSANRGLCAQPCRLPFSLGENKNVLSLKDLSLVDDIKSLKDAGITSLKIEGRMKRPEYVAAATSLCKKAALGEKITEEEKNDLQSVFSRSGFTKGYYENKINKEMFGIRSKDDVTSQAAALKKFHPSYEGVERQRIKVDFSLNIDNTTATLTACDIDGNKVTVSGGESQKVINHGISKETVSEKLSKTGSTPFIAREISVNIEEGFTLSVSQINLLRREALSKLLEIRGKLKPIPFYIDECKKELRFVSHNNFKIIEKYRFCFHNTSQIPDFSEIKGINKDTTEMIFVPLSQSGDETVKQLIKQGFRVGVSLPRAMFDGTEEIQKELLKAKDDGITDALCPNIGAVYCCEQVGFTIHGDFGLNITNRQSLKVYTRLSAKSSLISFETPLDCIRSIAKSSSIKTGITVYGRLPLMLVRNCPVRSFQGCRMSGCSIKDRMGCEFPLICDHRKDGASEILNSRPLNLSDRREEIENTGIDFINFLFTTENKVEAKSAIEDWISGKITNNEFTRGLYFKKVD